MNIVLIGYRGTGKSTVARLLGQCLKKTVLSTDAEIEKERGQSIPQIVEQYGWDYFRALETQVCRKLIGEEHLVIDTGGGIILRDENVRILKGHGQIVWLTADVPTIVARISGDSQRPSLSGTKSFVEEIEEIMTVRQPLYEAAADIIIATDHETPESLARQIIAKLECQS